MHPRKDPAEWHPAVARKGVAHAAAGGHERRRREDHAYQGEYQQARAPGLVLGRVHEYLEQGPVRRLDDVVDVVDAEEETGQEDEAGEHADADAVQHNLGALALRLGYLLDHVRGRVEACQMPIRLQSGCRGSGPSAIRTRQRKGPLQQAEHPSQSVGPADLVDELAIDKLAALVVGRRTRQDSDADDDEASHRPEKGRLGEQRQQAREEGVEEKGNESEPNIQEELVPWLGLILGIKQRNDVDDKRAPQQPSRRAQGHPARHVDPAGGVADGAAGGLPRDDGGPVVLPAGGGAGA